MNALTIIQGLVGSYIVWALVYLIVWGVIIRSRSSDYEGRTPGFWGVILWILTSLYPISLAIVLYALDRWIPSGDSIRNPILSQVVQSNHLASLFLPAILIFTILSAVNLFWLEIAEKFIRSHYKKLSRRAKIASYAGWILDGAFLWFTFYLYFGGEVRLAAWLIWCNAGAYLIVRMAKAPTQWAMPMPDYDYRFSSILLIALLGLLRIGVILLGGWLYLSISKLPVVVGQLSQSVYAVDTLRNITRETSPADPLGTVIAVSIIILIIDFLILFGMRNMLFGKARTWTVILLSSVPMLLPILTSKLPSNPILSIIILALGFVCGFLFLRAAPKDYVGLNSIYVWSFLYSLVLGAVCMAYSLNQDSYGSEGIPFLLIFQLFILMVGAAIGVNARSLIDEDDFQDYYDR
ncbi:MAG: hypothetical protein WCK35_07540 [Chloroflexota bacterium]